MKQQGAIEEYEDNELVVAIPDLPAVRGALGEISVGSGAEDPEERLGLALLPLRDVAAGGTKIREKYSEVAKRAIEAKRPVGTKLSNLDLIISWLREHFSSAYDHWVPTIGKNRVIDPVRGLPYLGGGGEGDPHLGGYGDPKTRSGANGGTSIEAPLDAPPPEWPPRPARPGQGVQVGVLDTQLYPNKWLAGGYIAAGDHLLRDPAAGHPPLLASAGHATFIAGLILHQAPGAELVIRPVLDEKADGKVWDTAKRMVGFIGSGVDILNLSFGCYTDDGQPPLALARAVSLVSAEILLVAAAGNHGNIDELKKEGEVPDGSWARGLTPVTPVWPAAFDEVIAVGATDGDHLAAFSPKTPWVDLTAPGVNVQSTYLTGKVKLGSHGGPETGKFSNGFAYWDGTSFAAATVSGAVAARIEPGRRNARQALACLREAPEAGIRPFQIPDR
jgi:membrane-anchored mycosin MYCP